MPSGLVEFTGTDTSTPPFSGTNAENLRDGDFTSIWAADGANGGYIGIDLGAATTYVSRLRVASRFATGNDNPGDKAIYGAALRSSSSDWPTFNDNALVATIESIDDVFYPANLHSLIDIPASTARRYWRLVGINGSYGPQMAEFYFEGPYGAGVSCRPVRPTIAAPHHGGGYASGKATVTLECETTSAQIYYADFEFIDPIGESATLYTGPFDFDFRDGPKILYFLAYDATCTTPASERMRATFSPKVFEPNSDWIDDTGALVDAHGGDVFDNRVRDNFWYLIGAFTNRQNNGVDIDKSAGVWMYRSTDCRNWKKIGYILPTPGSFNYCERPKLRYCASTGKYVIFAHGRAGVGASRLCTAESSSIDSGWGWENIDIQPDGDESRDFSVSVYNGKCWVASSNNLEVKIFRMADDFLDIHATPEYTVAIDEDRESPILLSPELTGRGWKLIFGVANYYNSDATFGMKSISTAAAEPTSGWDDLADAVDLFPYDPVGTEWNGQPAFVFKYGNALVLAIDHWLDDNLYGSRMTFLPLYSNPDGTIQAMPLQSWSLGDLHRRVTGAKSPGGTGALRL